MQNGVFNAANVLVDWEPVIGFRGVERRGIVFRIGVAIEVPARIDECVHRVGLAGCGSATLRARRVEELWNPAERRATFAGDFNLLGQ